MALAACHSRGVTQLLQRLPYRPSPAPLNPLCPVDMNMHPFIACVKGPMIHIYVHFSYLTAAMSCQCHELFCFTSTNAAAVPILLAAFPARNQAPNLAQDCIGFHSTSR